MIDPKAWERVQELVGQISSRAETDSAHSGSPPIFDCFGVRRVDAAFHRQVWLPCGGYIVIDGPGPDCRGRNTGGTRVKGYRKTIAEQNRSGGRDLPADTLQILAV
jgi:ribonuclease G